MNVSFAGGLSGARFLARVLNTLPSTAGLYFGYALFFRYALRRRFRVAVNEMMDCADGGAGAKLRVCRNNAVGSVDRQTDIGVAAAALHPHR